MEQFKHITIEATGFCNAKCKWCKTGRKNRRGASSKTYLELDTCEKGIQYLIDKKIVYQEDCIVDLYNWGEPFLNKNLVEIIDIVTSYGMKIGLSTNGSQYMDIPEKYMESIEYLVFSVSGFSKKTYDNVHRLNLEKVLGNIKRFAKHFNEYGFGNRLVMNFHVYQYNIPEIEAAASFCHENNISFSPHIAYLADESLFIKYLTHTLDAETYTQASKEILFGLIENIKEHVPDEFQCPQWNNLVLDDKMNVLPCCLFTSDEKIKNIYEYENGDEIKKDLMNSSYCRTCIATKQAQIVMNPMLFEWGYKSANYVLPKIYYGNNREFCEEKTIQCSAIENGKQFSMKIRVPERTKYIRFDPLENKNLIIENLNFFMAGEELRIIDSNAVESLGEYIKFESLDPWVIVEIPEKNEARVVCIDGKCIWY